MKTWTEEEVKKAIRERKSVILYEGARVNLSHSYGPLIDKGSFFTLSHPYGDDEALDYPVHLYFRKEEGCPLDGTDVLDYCD